MQNRILRDRLDWMRQELAWSGVSGMPLSRRARRAAFLARRALAYADASAQVVTSSGDTSRGRSPQIWSRVPVMNLIQDPSQGFFGGDDFKSFGGSTANGYVSEAGIYAASSGVGATITQQNTGPTTVNGPGGVVALSTPATINIQAALEAGFGNGGSYEVVNGAPPARLAFEARVQFSNVAQGDVFIGLLEKGISSAATFLFSAGDALAQKSFIGYEWVKAGAGTLNATAGLNGQAALAAPGTFAPTAGQWCKLGFLYDSTQPGNQIQFYANGLLLGGFSSPGIANFPTGAVLTPSFAINNDATNAVGKNLLIDWWYGAVIFQG